jgi:GNAT superfamily N-acetyltransferase
LSRAISISLRSFDESVRKGYLRLFPGDPDKSAALLNWRTRANPHGETKFAVATEGDKVVGMIALIPTRLRGPTGDCLGYQAVDTAVDPAYRGQGLFVKMGAMAQDPSMLGGDVLWGFPNANAAPGWYGRLGWMNFGAVPLLMRPLRSGFLIGRLHPKLRSIDFPLIRNRKIEANRYSDGAQLAADFEPLWRQIAPGFGIAVDRSGAWLRWRLLDKPGAEYRCVGLKSDGELGSFVATKVADKHGGRLCYVMEALSLPKRTRDLSRMLLAELALAARNGAEAALAWCPKHAPNYAAYRRAGFVPVPPRLRPIEINFGARALRPESAAAAAADAAWYVSFLDSDTN